MIRAERLLRLIPLDLDESLFTMRGLTPRGKVSAGGSCRLIRTGDGWMAVNLAREEDRVAVPAWIGPEEEVQAGEGEWGALERVARGRKGEEFAARGQWLGIPAAVVPPGKPTPSEPYKLTRLGPGGQPSNPPVVIDFSSLWAGPLCGHLLTRLGARVIKVESFQRPDGARFGPAAFFEKLHAGQEMMTLDFSNREKLTALVAQADLVIEASRPRALAQWGLSPDAIRANPALSWVSITAYGRADDRVGFGDDVAAAAGLIDWDAAGEPMFRGDALADPLAGLAATAGALAALRAGGGMLVEVPMIDAARFVA